MLRCSIKGLASSSPARKERRMPKKEGGEILKQVMIILSIGNSSPNFNESNEDLVTGDFHLINKKLEYDEGFGKNLSNLVREHEPNFIVIGGQDAERVSRVREVVRSVRRTTTVLPVV
jgi:hypothetical protein